MILPAAKRMVCLMSEEEVRIVDRYLEKYQITNKARWLRETVLAFIHQNMEEIILHFSRNTICADKLWQTILFT